MNTDAVNMITYSPHSYKQMVLNCVTASQRLEGKLSIHAVIESFRCTYAERLFKHYNQCNIPI